MRANPVFRCYEPKNMVESHRYGMAWYGTVRYCMARKGMVWYGLGCEGIRNCVLGVLTTPKST